MPNERRWVEIHSKSILRFAFRDKFRSLHKEAFQAWFEELAKALHGQTNFQAIRVSQGDGGMDGFVINSQLVYQVYAPARIDELRDSVTAKKIVSNFHSLYQRLGLGLRSWAFVHNHPEAKLGHLSGEAIATLKQRYPDIEFMVEDIDSLWSKLSQLPEDDLQHLCGPSLLEGYEPLWAVPILPTPFFTGREKELEALESALHDIQSGPVVLNGLGGAGKTQTALAYAHRHRDQYKAVLWVTAENQASIDHTIQEAALLIGIQAQTSKERLDEVIRWMNKNKDWLLIIDNADNPTLGRTVMPTSRGGHIIVTSRLRSFAQIGARQIIEIGNLAPKDAELFLRRRIRREVVLFSGKERTISRRFLRDVGYLALAIEQAGAYIDAEGISISEYWSRFQRKKLSVLEKYREISGDYSLSVRTTWELNFDQVSNVPQSAEILWLSAFLASEDIPVALLMDASAVSRNVSPSTLIEPLTRFSLVSFSPSNKTFDVHRLVQMVIRDRFSLKQRREFRSSLVRALSKGIEGQLPHVEASSILPHIAAFFAAKEPVRDLDTVRLLLLSALKLKEGGLFASALRLIRRARSWAGMRSSDVGSILIEVENLYGLLLKDQGRFAESQDVLEGALSMRLRADGIESLSYAEGLNNLGVVISLRGSHGESLRHLCRALRIRKKLAGNFSDVVAESYGNIGLILERLECLNSAELAHSRALTIRRSLLNRTHPKIAILLNKLGAVAVKKKNYRLGELYFLRALAIRCKELGPDHPAVATSLSNLGYSALKRGETQRALRLHQKALDIRERALDPNHPDVAISMQNLYRTYQQLNEPLMAYEALLRATKIQRRAYGRKDSRVQRGIEELDRLRKSLGLP